MKLKELTEKEKDAVLAEVGYTRKQLDSDLEHIKDWLKLQHHLPPSSLKESDCFLANFLTGCKGSLEKVKRKLDGYYTLRSHGEIFDCRDPLDPGYVKFKNLIYFALSPNLVNRKRFVYYKLAEVDQAKFDVLSYIRTIFNMSEQYLRYERNFSVKCCLLFDGKDVTVSDHIAKIKPLQVKDFIYYAMNALPYRYSDICVINAPEYLVMALKTLVLPFLPKKLTSRLRITANGFEEVSQYFDKSVLPRDYGGDLPTMKEINDFWRDTEIKHRDWFVNELSERCDESKRIISEDPANPYFGVPGSLKKLVVD